MNSSTFSKVMLWMEFTCAVKRIDPPIRGPTVHQIERPIEHPLGGRAGERAGGAADQPLAAISILAGTHCVDNSPTPERAEGFVAALPGVGRDRVRDVRAYEFMADFRVHARLQAVLVVAAVARGAGGGGSAGQGGGGGSGAGGGTR